MASRCVFRFTGTDRFRYLNGQVTNDLAKAAKDRAIYACVATAKGKLEGDLFLAPHPDGQSFWVDGPGELREALLARLEKFIIADDVAVEDLTAEVAIWHVLGQEPPATAGWNRRANRFGTEGWDVVATAGADPLRGFAALDPAAVEEFRLACGVGIWGRELGPEVLPQEAQLQDRAVDFHKGCYVGQEVISRIKSVGKVNRELCVLVKVSDDEWPLAPGDSLWDGAAEAGWITSVSEPCRLPRIIALGYVKRGSCEPGTELTCRRADRDRFCRMEVRLAPLRELNE